MNFAMLLGLPLTPILACESLELKTRKTQMGRLKKRNGEF
jgi:hypothetical protein